MLDQVVHDFEKKENICILGFGREGKSAYAFFKKYLPEKHLTILDQNEGLLDKESDFIKEIEDDIKNKKTQFILGKDCLEKLEHFDLILKSPGISFKDLSEEYVSNVQKYIMSQNDILLKYFPDNLVIGVTGTKGKSTTSTLIYEVLKKQKDDVIFLGNIGIPVLEKIEEITKDTTIVLEISSHQLEFMKYKPQIGILLNIYEEHLDHHRNYGEYINAKFNILEKAQKNHQYQLIGSETEAMRKKDFKYADNSYTVNILNESKEKVKTHYEVYKKDKNIYIKDKYNLDSEDEILAENLNLKIKGEQNIQNASFALIVAKILNLDLKLAQKTIESFKGLPHRLEFVEKINGVSYYNDSISTIGQATIRALQALPQTETVIIGGKDRGVDLSQLTTFLNEIYTDEKYSLKNIILLPDTGNMIEKDILNVYNKIKVKDVKQAAEVAYNITKKGVCLLSPAAASYGFYKNFEDRGEQFKQKLLEIKKKNEEK